ncbi:MAG TPA: histidinol dehydrogenase [Candidatus Tyrphobacter sp.]
MTRTLQIVAASDRELAAFYRAGWQVPEDVAEGVRAILADVRARGDAALTEYTRRWDAPEFEVNALRVSIPAQEQAQALVPQEIARGLALAKERVTRFHERQRRADISYEDPDGTRYAFVTRPLDAVAAYVPGGSAPLPSTAVMTIVPAKIVGVSRVVVLTPPQRDGRVHPAVLFACSLCGADELYAVGGAQAVAAAAFGTASIAPVDKIVGPGNLWVTEAKRQVYGVCAIDGLAGPSEVLVVADETTNPEYAAAELLAQAEHDRAARVAVVSESREILERIARVIEARDLHALPRGDIIAEVVEQRCRLIYAATFEETCDVIERFAPEHLALQVREPTRILQRVRHAGAVFTGSDTPVACGDYLAGSNHVLPTSGSARFASGLCLSDFTRTFSVVGNSAERMRGDAPALAALAEFEGLDQHAETARMRR